MVNLLEKELFEKIEKKFKGEEIFIGLNSSMLIISGVDKESELIKEMQNLVLFCRQFRKEYKKIWQTSNFKDNPLLKPIALSNYMFQRINQINEYPKLKGKGDKFLIHNPFQNLNKEQEIIASWISVCSRLGIKNIGLLTDGEKLRGYIENESEKYTLNLATQDLKEFDKVDGYVKYPKSAIVSEILTQRAWNHYHSGRFEKAIKESGKAIEIFPNYITALFCRGKSKRKKGLQMKKKGQQGSSLLYTLGAIEDFERLTQEDIQPNYAKAYYEMGRAYITLKNAEGVNNCAGRLSTLGSKYLLESLRMEIKRLNKKPSLLDKLDRFLSS